jgi:hypothetical protein
MNPTNNNTPWPSAKGVTAVLDDLLGKAQPPRARPSLTYLRRKPGRGLVAVYGKASDPRSMYTVTVEESATSGQQSALSLDAPPGAGPVGAKHAGPTLVAHRHTLACSTPDHGSLPGPPLLDES